MLYFVILFLSIFFFGLGLFVLYKCDYEIIPAIFGFISIAVGAIGLIVSIFLTIIIITENVAPEGQKIKWETRYDFLVYQLEEIKYDNLIDNNRKELMDDIQDYNVAIQKGKLYQNNFWLGIFYADIYDDLPLIELK